MLKDTLYKLSITVTGATDLVNEHTLQAIMTIIKHNIKCLSKILHTMDSELLDNERYSKITKTF